MESLTNRQKELEKSLNERVLKLNEQLKAGEITQTEAEESREWLLSVGQNEMQKAINRQMTNVQKEIALMEKDCQTKILQIQNERKLLAVLLPPVLPLLIAILVFVYRKNQERLGVSARRLRK